MRRGVGPAGAASTAGTGQPYLVVGEVGSRSRLGGHQTMESGGVDLADESPLGASAAIRDARRRRAAPPEIALDPSEHAGLGNPEPLLIKSRFELLADSADYFAGGALRRHGADSCRVLQPGPLVRIEIDDSRIKVGQVSEWQNQRMLLKISMGCCADNRQRELVERTAILIRRNMCARAVVQGVGAIRVIRGARTDNWDEVPPTDESRPILRTRDRRRSLIQVLVDWRRTEPRHDALAASQYRTQLNRCVAVGRHV